MMRRMVVALMALGVLLMAPAGLPAAAEQAPAPMDLLDALGTGKVDAVFYGNGDESVRGRIRRSAFGPEKLYVAPGTQFWAQREGLQGMTTLGWIPIDLARDNIAYVNIPAACTNYARPAPTPYDRMNPVCCPEPRMAALAEQVGRVHPAHAVAQIAVWAVANNPQWSDISGLVEAKATDETAEERAETVATWRQEAAALMATAGLNTVNYRMFR